MFLKNFSIRRPPYETEQEKAFSWFADAHVKAGAERGAIEALLEKVGCKPEKIHKRGHILPDYLHTNWDKMEVFRLNETPSGRDLAHRMKIFEEWTDSLFEGYYSPSECPPDDLIHTTCTGYVSPSSAQKLVARRGWGEKTSVTHAYHMGCYAAIPSIRMASGYLALHPDKERVDIVHTEACSLHTNPAGHKADQIVAQTLFSDGSIKYSVQRDEGDLKILATSDEIIKDSHSAMTWNLSSWGYEMSLSKELPVLILRAIEGAFQRLCQKGTLTKRALFAIHPGGPKILTYIQEALKLEQEQISHSTQILKNYGNMSSATLPHIWDSICRDPSIPKGTPIVSFAFGPGLSIWSALMEKQ